MTPSYRAKLLRAGARCISDAPCRAPFGWRKRVKGFFVVWLREWEACDRAPNPLARWWWATSCWASLDYGKGYRS